MPSQAVSVAASGGQALLQMNIVRGSMLVDDTLKPRIGATTSPLLLAWRWPPRRAISRFAFSSSSAPPLGLDITLRPSQPHFGRLAAARAGGRLHDGRRIGFAVAYFSPRHAVRSSFLSFSFQTAIFIAAGLASYAARRFDALIFMMRRRRRAFFSALPVSACCAGVATTPISFHAADGSFRRRTVQYRRRHAANISPIFYADQRAE